MDRRPDASPRCLGKYRLDRLIGKGGMGEVYAAWDTSLDRLVALKTIRSESDDEAHAERFRREGRAAARLRHPLIVTIYELGEAEGKLYMAMEYLEGESLAAAARSGSLTAERKLDVLALLLDGLHHAHGHGVVHRDVKPSNVQLVPDGSLKVLDFGIARLMAAESLSQTGMVLGTVPYMSPEQLRGERVDHRTDVYAAGIVAYELFMGHRPFDGQTLTEIVLKVINDPLPPLDPSCSREHPGLEGILVRALDKSAANRYASAAEMAADLRLLGPEKQPAPSPASATFHVPRPVCPPAPAAAPPCPALPEPPPVRAGRVPPLAVGVAVALAVLSAASILVARHRGPHAPRASMAPGSAGAAGISRPPGELPPSAAPAIVPVSPAAPAPPAGPAVPVGHAGLARALARELRSRGVATRGGDRLEAGLDVSVRAAPFTASSAVTADFTARAVLARAGRRSARCEVGGHALEFSEPSARAAAVARAAEQLAECLASSAGVR